jgi:hypothetical protein
VAVRFQIKTCMEMAQARTMAASKQRIRGASMNEQDFDELAGRIEGVGRALLLLAWTMERETDMDGPSLTRRWRESVPDHSTGTAVLAAASRTLQELALGLDRMRADHQQRRAQHLGQTDR